MWIQQSNRNNLLEIIGGKTIYSLGYSSEQLPINPVHQDDFYMIWDKNPFETFSSWGGAAKREHEQIPNIIVLGDGKVRDFLAWANTYLPGFKPFSAYCRVLDISTASNFRTPFQNLSLNKLEPACIGVIICESLALVTENNIPLRLSPLTCSSSLSYCLARGLALGLDSEGLELITDKWLQARHITKQPNRMLGINNLKFIWKTIAILQEMRNKNTIRTTSNHPSFQIIQACWELMNQGKISDRSWVDLIEGSAELKDAQEKMNGTREDRVRTFQKYMSDISPLRLEDKFYRAFVCGFLASKLSPGSLSHYELVKQYFRDIPEAFMWYGLCLGLNINDELLGSFNSLGRLLLRNLLCRSSITDRPRADINLAELEMLLDPNSQTQVAEFNSFISNILEIELIPNITTYVRWQNRELVRQGDASSDSQMDAKNRETIREITSTLEVLAKKFEQLTKNILPDSKLIQGPYDASKKEIGVSDTTETQLCGGYYHGGTQGIYHGSI